VSKQRYAAITGWGMAVPQRVVTNDELSQRMDTSDEWIRTRTGIAARHIAGPGEHTSALGAAAGRRALERAGRAPATIDTVIVATCTPDQPFPATAAFVQAELGCTRAAAFDLVAACSGFVYGISVASSLISSGMSRRVLLVAAEVFSNLINWNDRATAVLFGDGAAALVLEATDEPFGLLATQLGADGGLADLMTAEAGGTRCPLTPELQAAGAHLFQMNGREVFRHAVREMSDVSLAVLAQAGYSLTDVDLVVPHQANVRIIEAIARRLEVPLERFVINLDRYGNTSAASIPLALCEAADDGRLQPGMLVLVTAFGGGVTWGSALLRWGRPQQSER
jgi:3-oxoacyl-[acyl-carrier-protein] synthase III